MPSEQTDAAFGSPLIVTETGDAESGANDAEVVLNGGRLYRVDEEEDDSEDEDINLRDDSPKPVRRDPDDLLNRTCPAEYLLQAAAADDTLLPYLPSQDAVNVVFGAGEPDYAPSPRTVSVRHALGEDVLMMDLFMPRLPTPVFLTWMERDGVSGRDDLIAVQRLRGTMHERVTSLCGAHAVQT